MTGVGDAMGNAMKRADRAQIRVAVLAGGTSDEREVSLMSGEHARSALKEAGYRTVDLVDPADPAFITEMTDHRYDVAFLALHGPVGEDGTIQGFLEFIGMPYTCSDVLATACAADKHVAKILYAAAGIPVARDVIVERGDVLDPDAVLSAVGPQCFVKPALNGSSYGISLVKRHEELSPAVEKAFHYSNRVLVEQRLVGTEITVGVVGGLELRALPVVEIHCGDAAEFYDLDVKYISPEKIHRIPAGITPEHTHQAQELACRAHRALGCYGVSRSDFIVTEDGPVILETNTIPGMTAASLLPDMMRHTQTTFAEVCAELIDLALKRNEK